MFTGCGSPEYDCLSGGTTDDQDIMQCRLIHAIILCSINCQVFQIIGNRTFEVSTFPLFPILESASTQESLNNPVASIPSTTVVFAPTQTVTISVSTTALSTVTSLISHDVTSIIPTTITEVSQKTQISISIQATTIVPIIKKPILQGQSNDAHVPPLGWFLPVYLILLLLILIC